MSEKKKRTICIDFDGVLHDYSNGYQGENVFGEMIPGADTATKVLKKSGNTIIIFTTRPATDELKKWLKDNNISYDYINENPDQPKGCEGTKLIADIYIDDRGLCFRGQWDEWFLRQIGEFSPWEEEKRDQEKEMEQAYKEGDIWRLGREKRYRNGKLVDCVKSCK